MFICDLREKYRQLRDFHVLSTNLQEILSLTSSSSGGNIEIIRGDFSATFIKLATVLYERRSIDMLPYLFLALLHVPRLSLVP